jgi:hypothetical protein
MVKILLTTIYVIVLPTLYIAAIMLFGFLVGYVDMVSTTLRRIPDDSPFWTGEPWFTSFLLGDILWEMAKDVHRLFLIRKQDECFKRIMKIDFMMLAGAAVLEIADILAIRAMI